MIDEEERQKLPFVNKKEKGKSEGNPKNFIHHLNLLLFLIDFSYFGSNNGFLVILLSYSSLHHLIVIFITSCR